MPEKYKNPWEAWHGTDDLLRGKSSDLDWERKLTPGQGLVGDTSSKNDPVVAATYGAVKATPGHWVWDDWERYFDLPWMSSETASHHIYGTWINASVWTLWCIMKERAMHPHIQDLARLHTRASLGWMALTSWPWGGQRDGPHYSCMTGARSGVSKEGEDGKRYDAAGLPNPIYYIDGGPAEGMISIADAQVPYPKTTMRKRWDSVSDYGMVWMEHVLTDDERYAFHRVLMDGSPAHVEEVADWLRAVPGPHVPIRSKRTTDGIVSICENSTQPVSTHMLYGLAYFADIDGPALTWQDKLRWPKAPVLWLAADNVAQRTHGRHGRAGLEADHMWCQRLEQDWWHPIEKEWITGRNQLPIPGGQPVFDVRWHGASVTTGHDPNPDNGDDGNWCDWFGDLFGN